MLTSLGSDAVINVSHSSHSLQKAKWQVRREFLGMPWHTTCGGNFHSFGGEFCRILPSQNGMFLAFQNRGISDLAHFLICQYYSTTAMVENGLDQIQCKIT